MSNECNFFINVFGSIEQLKQVQDFLAPAVHESNDAWESYVLDISKLYEDICENEHHFLGLAVLTIMRRHNGAGSDRMPTASHQKNSKRSKNCSRTLQIPITDLNIRYDLTPHFTAWIHNKYSRNPELLQQPQLSLHGVCQYCPPGIFAERLTKQFPGLYIEWGGTTGTRIDFELWSCTNGISKRLTAATDDIQAGTTVWHVYEGQVLDPEWEINE